MSLPDDKAKWSTDRWRQKDVLGVGDPAKTPDITEESGLTVRSYKSKKRAFDVSTVLGVGMNFRRLLLVSAGRSELGAERASSENRKRAGFRHGRATATRRSRRTPGGHYLAGRACVSRAGAEREDGYHRD
jgi:hypothetical protein